MTSIDTTSQDFVQEMYGDKELRWYQRAAINELAFHLQRGVKRVVIVQPTGAGKTLTIAASMSDPEVRKSLGVPLNNKLRILFVAHKHRLLTQAEQTFVDDSEVELITQSMFSDIPEDVIKKGWHVCILDEGHHESCQSFNMKLEKLGEAPIIALTATPDRPDKMVLKMEVIIAPISRDQAVVEGYLAPTKIHSFVDSPSKDKIGILTEILTDYGHQMGQTMIFVKTKREVTALEKVIRELGYVGVGILSQSEKELDKLLNQFSKGEVQFLINCNKISEGVDVKGCTDVVLGRQVGSYPLLNQIIGRAARPDSECNVWELVDPLNGNNLDTTVVVGTPESHRLINKERGVWKQRMFDYVSTKSSRILGIAEGIRIRY